MMATPKPKIQTVTAASAPTAGTMVISDTSRTPIRIAQTDRSSERPIWPATALPRLRSIEAMPSRATSSSPT